jgi:hypothetical protein
MSRYKIATLSTLLFSFLLLASLTGCKKDSEKVAPVIPPESSFVMDFTGFTNPADTNANREIGSYHNWGYSYVNVVSWNAVLTAGLAVPVAAFRESFNHEGVFHPDENNWTWSYNVTSNNSVYEAELTGKILGDSIKWEMRITRDNVYSDFLWFYGKSAIDQSGGYWILMSNPLASAKMLKIDWNKYTSNLADIKYTNIVPGNSDNGSYIFYGITTGDYDRFYEIYKHGVSNLTDIEWNAQTRIGRVKDQQHFGDELWHCWDNNLLDTSCQ